MTHTTILTLEYLKRTQQAISETEALLAKELSFSAELQYSDKITFYKGHIEKLSQYVKDGFITNQIPQ